MSEIATTSDQVPSESLNNDDNLMEVQTTATSSISEIKKGKQIEIIPVVSDEEIQSTSTEQVQANSSQDSDEIIVSSNDLMQLPDTTEVLTKVQVDMVQSVQSPPPSSSSSSSSSSSNNVSSTTLLTPLTLSTPSPTTPKQSSKEINNNRGRNAGLNDIDIRNYLQFTAAMIIGVPLKELDDHSISLMKLGMDSNTSTILLKKIADILPSFIELPATFIDDNPSIDLITQFILDIMSGGGENYNKQKQKLPNELEEEQEKLQRSIEDLVDKYTLYIRENYVQQSSGVETRTLIRSTGGIFVEEKVFLLTGATGFLGSHILNTLLCHSESTIYCLVKRKKARSPKASLKRAFLRNGFDSSLIDSKQLVALSSNLSEPYLGLTVQQYEEISQKVTLVIHGAYSCSLSSKFSNSIRNSLIHYENNFISGTANLLLFSAQKEFHFISSLDCCLNGPWEKVPEGIIPLKTSITTGDGYGLTKLALETILINTFDYLQLERVSIIRTSQLTSNSKSGVWNPNDMTPLLLRNAGITGNIPIFEEKLDWVPVDIAAKSIIDLVITENRLCRVEVFHVSNPNPVIMWKDYLDILEGAAGMKFERIELEKWLEKLEESIAGGIHDGGMFMILNGYFKRFLNREMEKRGDDSTSMGRATLDIINTKSRTYILSKCPSLNEELVKLNIDWLRNTGNLSELVSPSNESTSKVILSDSSNSTNTSEKQLQRKNKLNKLKKSKIEGEGSIWNLLYVTIPLMVFFFVIDILWSIVSKSFLEVSIIVGWVATVIFVDDNHQQRNVADASEELLNDIDRIEREFRNHKKNSINGRRRIVFRKRIVRNVE